MSAVVYVGAVLYRGSCTSRAEGPVLHCGPKLHCTKQPNTEGIAAVATNKGCDNE